MNKTMLARSVAAALAVSLVAASCAGDEETTDTAVTTEEGAETSEVVEDDEAPETSEVVEDDEAPEDDEASEAELNIVEAAQANGDFSILVEAVIAADLVDALSDTEGEFTVFAPTNEAFEAFLADSETTKDDLLANPDLADILKNHVLTTKVDAEAATKAATNEDVVETLQGGSLTLSLDGDNIKVGEATVVTADVETTNGVIHAIDQVIPLG